MQTVSFISNGSTLTCRETGASYAIEPVAGVGFYVERTDGFDEFLAIEPSRQRALNRIEADARLGFLVAQAETGAYSA